METEQSKSNYKVRSLEKMLDEASESKRRLLFLEANVRYQSSELLEYAEDICKNLKISYEKLRSGQVTNLEHRTGFFDMLIKDGLKRNIDDVLYFEQCICDACYMGDYFASKINFIENIFGKKNVYIAVPMLSELDSALHINFPDSSTIEKISEMTVLTPEYKIIRT